MNPTNRIHRAAVNLGASEGRKPRLFQSCRRVTATLAIAAGCFFACSASAQPPDLKSLRLAIEDLQATFSERYASGPQFSAQLAELEKLPPSATQTPDFTNRVTALRQQALLANPLLDFSRLLLVRRNAGHLGLPQNWQGNCAIAPTGYDNDLAVLSPVGPAGRLTPLFAPEGKRFVGDVDLHFDADRMLFSMPDERKRWAIWELRADGTGLRRISPADEPDVDWYDPCYLPDGRILFAGTACMAGVPCVGGGNKVANLYLLDPVTGKLRQVTFDQEHNWCPTVLNNGRVLYSRWEYTDSPHYFTRLLFHMNPDGTGQMEFYGSNSYWPNSIFYARPIPGHPTMVVAVISGHHGVPRMGELVVFDPAKSRHEAGGAVQRIPGRDQPVKPTIADQLVEGSWPRFLHPYPLSEKYFLVSCQPAPGANWGLYLADVFDNLVLLHESPGNALLEPLPLRPTSAPPAIPDKVNLAQTEATVLVQDVYAGPGLAGVPRGTVKKMRVIEYHYAYPQMGGHINIGIDGPWDVHRILGTVPVNEDGSASFRVPANRPLAVQPLDAEGKALQVMRSWFTAMPGESVSCVGCHEAQNSAVTPHATLAASKPPVPIEEWYGPARGFSFEREVQPVLDRHCVGCHNGTARADAKTIPDFRGDQPDVALKTRNARKKKVGGFEFSAGYVALHPFVRRPGPESDYHLQVPGEWHADTSELVQMLQAGHHGVKLDAESWDRLITWIDLNVPDHGTWTEHRAIPANFHQRRQELLAKYANRTDDPEKYPAAAPERSAAVAVAPEPEAKQTPAPVVQGWPFSADEAKKRQTDAGLPVEIKIPLSDKLTMALRLIPAGEFVVGGDGGAPFTVARVEKPFYLGACEVSNEELAAFNPAHDSGYISEFNKDQSTRGQNANRPRGASIRVSWDEATAFCRWLSEKTGRKFSLPTEAQWEWACRAGTATPWSFGANGDDFSRHANLADARLLQLCRADSPKWIPAIASVNDGAVVVDQVGRYQPNAWGLRDMHGNAAEWTGTDNGGRKIVRGGSFYDRPQRATSSARVSYPPWQKVFNVGFRVACAAAPAGEKEMAQAASEK
jgi:formylglycine-generating enzyme required for sulfatase activity